MFLLTRIFPFSTSDPEVESTWSTTKWRQIKSFDTWYYIATCATLCGCFSSKSKETNVFPKHILKSKARDQSVQATKKLFCHVIVKNYLCNLLFKFLIKIESTWRSEIKEKTPSSDFTNFGRIVRSSHRRCSIKNLFSKILQYSQETPVLGSLFSKVADLSVQPRCFLWTAVFWLFQMLTANAFLQFDWLEQRAYFWHF